MNTPETITFFLDLIMLVPTLASLTRFDQWWVRGFDFPRLQISVLILLVGIFSILIYDFQAWWQWLMLILLSGSFFYQAVKIFPYTVLDKKQVLHSKNPDPENTISILVSNVLTSNKRSDKLIAHVQEKQPDILLTLETDERWEKELSVIEETYPFTVKIPQENLYGMHLYSRLKLEDIKVENLITTEVPSIHGHVWLRNGRKVEIHCLHPKPPSPSEDDTSTNRDAELLLVGKKLKPKENSILVFGDLNDVAWSRTTRLFQRISGLLDPRIGRGFYNTFHAKYPLFRWPLDHVFHTKDFYLVALKRLKSINSDHFPMYIKLSYKPVAEENQERPDQANGKEKEWAEEKVEKGDPKKGKDKIKRHLYPASRRV